MERISATLHGVRETLSDIEQTKNNIDRIKYEYNAVMDKLAHKIAGSFSNPLKYAPGHADAQKEILVRAQPKSPWMKPSKR